MDIYDNIRKVVTFSLCVIGAGLFYLMVMLKVHVMAEQTEARIQKLSTEQDWQFLQEQKVSSAPETDQASRGSF